MPKNYWCAGSLESQVYVRHCELLHGVMDKAQYGKFGLVHSVQVRLYTRFLLFPFSFFASRRELTREWPREALE